MLPVTIHLKTCNLGVTHGVTRCYAWYALTFLLHAFAWPLHLPNMDVTTKLSKNSESK